jgi:hypothetical protein
MRSSLGLRGLRSPSELHRYAPVGTPTSSPGIGPVRVTWRTSLSDTCSSVPFRPSIDMLSGVHSRVDVATASSGSNRPDSNHVPTSWFRTTSPVCSAVHPVTGAAANPPLLTIPLRVAGLLHPAANRGVHRVSLLVAPVARSGRRSRDAPTPRRIPPILSRTVSPRPVPSCRSLAALLGPGGFAFPLAPFNPHPAVSVGFKALLCGWVRTTVRRFRRPMAYPPVGFSVPFKVLRSRSSAFASDRDEQPTRLRGPVTVPIEHIPVGSIAAPSGRREARRGASFRCPPHHRRSREDGGESVVQSRAPEGAWDGANASDHRRLEEAAKPLPSVWTMIRLESLDGLPHESR